MKRKIIGTAMTAFILMLSACGGFSWHQDGNESKEYKTMHVTTTDRMLTREYSAVLSGRQAVEVRPQVSGKITAIHIDEGARVRRGQPLFTIDQTPYKAALRTAQANVSSARAAVATARMAAESKRELYDKHVISAFELQKAENALAEAEAAVAQAEAQADNASNDLSYTVVTSPVDGTAGMLPYRVGHWSARQCPNRYAPSPTTRRCTPTSPYQRRSCWPSFAITVRLPEASPAHPM